MGLDLGGKLRGKAAGRGVVLFPCKPQLLKLGIVGGGVLAIVRPIDIGGGGFDLFAAFQQRAVAKGAVQPGRETLHRGKDLLLFARRFEQPAKAAQALPCQLQLLLQGGVVGPVSQSAGLAQGAKVNENVEGADQRVVGLPGILRLNSDLERIPGILGDLLDDIENFPGGLLSKTVDGADLGEGEPGGLIHVLNARVPQQRNANALLCPVDMLDVHLFQGASHALVKQGLRRILRRAALDRLGIHRLPQPRVDSGSGFQQGFRVLGIRTYCFLFGHGSRHLPF